MGEKQVNGRRKFGKGFGRAFALIALSLMVVSGCGRMPTPEEITQQREENARQDVDLIKPSQEYGNFGEMPLTLEDCIHYALKNNLEIRMAEFNREIASQQTLADKLSMLPSLNANASYRYRDELRKSDTYNWLIDQDVPDYTVGELKDNGWANLVLTWNILDTMMAYVRSTQSEMREEVLKRQYTRQSQQLALDVTRAYWNAAAVEDALDYVHVVENNLKEVKRNIDSAVEARSMDQMAAKDVEMRLKELEITIRQLQANLSKERLELARLMGLNQNVQFTLARPPIKPIIGSLPHTKDLNIDDLEEWALLHRPELFVSDMQVLIQKEEARNKVLSMFPGMNLFAGTHYEANRLLLSNSWNTVGAGVGWELLELPTKYALYKGQEKAVEMAKAERLMTTVGVITQVHIALLDYAIKVDRFRLLDETYALASNLYELAETKNKAGRLPALAVTQRNLEQMAAKLRRDEAVVDLLVAHKRLCVTVGVDPLECQPGGMSAQAASGEGYTYTETTGMKRWKCNECGHIHTGPEPPNECPICGIGKEGFIEVTNNESAWTPSSTDSAPPPPAEGAVTGDDQSLESWGKSAPILTQDELAKNTAQPGYAGRASDQFLWTVQVGAFVEQGGPPARIAEIRDMAKRLADNRDAIVSTTRINGQLFNRVRVMGLPENQAQLLAKELTGAGFDAWVIAPHSANW